MEIATWSHRRIFEGQSTDPTAVPWLARPSPEGKRWREGPLLAKTQPADDLLVPIEVLPAQVIQQTAALADHPEQTLSRVVILGVGLEVLGQMLNASGEKSDLDLGGTGVPVVGLVALDDLGLATYGLRHRVSSSGTAVLTRTVQIAFFSFLSFLFPFYSRGRYHKARRHSNMPGSGSTEAG